MMGAGGDSTTSDGLGGRVSWFLGAIVAFIAGLFHPVFRLFGTNIIPLLPQPPTNQNRDTGSDDTTQYQHLADQDDEPQQEQQQQPKKQEEEENDADQDADPGDMQRQLHGQRFPATTGAMPQHPIGAKEVSANGRSNIKVALPQILPAANGHAKQNTPLNVEATKTALGDVTNSINNLRFSAAEKNEAKDSTQDDLELPPAVQSLDEEPEDPVKAAEREIHHGFMNEALDMVRCSLLFLHLETPTSRPSSFVHYYLSTDMPRKIAYTLDSNETV